MDGFPKKFMVFSPFNIYERTLFTLWKFYVGSKQFTTVWSVESVRVQQPEQAHWNVCRIACFIIIIIIIGTNCSFIFSFSVRVQILFTCFLLCRLKGCICCRMGWDGMKWNGCYYLTRFGVDSRDHFSDVCECEFKHKCMSV